MAQELAKTHGVLEPLQTASSIDGQVQELRETIDEYGEIPAVLIGWSWGAWLSFILASSYPAYMGKLILVGSGPFEEKYAAEITATRISRLNKKDRTEFEALVESLDRFKGKTAPHPDSEDADTAFARLGELTGIADSYDPLPVSPSSDEVHFDVFESVWREARELRRSGELLRLAENIRCPVVAVHGDYDPHPYEGVRIPLSKALKDFRFILLENCGHSPWTEREAKDTFFRILRELL